MTIGALLSVPRHHRLWGSVGIELDMKVQTGAVCFRVCVRVCPSVQTRLVPDL